MNKKASVPHRLSERFAEADLVDRIFDYIVEQLPELKGRATEVKDAVRAEFAGEKVWVTKRSADERQRIAQQTLEFFNGRNVSEVARRLQISRATVYRLLRQAGRV